MTKTPASLLERLRRPDAKEAWDRFVVLYTPLIFHWARKAGLSPDDAGDLVQDVLTTLVRRMPEFSYDRGRSFRGWLRTVTLNAWRQRFRARPQPAGVEGLDQVPDPETGPDFEEEEYRRHLVGRALQVMRAEFQPTTWQACWESVVLDRPAAEVAEKFGLTVNAVYIAKFRVLRRLREELKDLLD